jgi:glycerol-3-phosphate dehydrogenase
MTAATAFQRDAMLARLGRAPVDVLVIGGGITGCGVALDAAARGLSVALVERDDFASGTSSKSSKLIHGGLRYLQQGDVRLVYEALRERQRLIRNAPHLVSILPFLIPVLTKDGPVSERIAKALRSALWTYDLTGGVRIGRRHRRLDAAAALAHCPTLPADRLSSGFVYFDAQADDARVTLAVARAAAAHGAVVVNRCEVVDLVHDAAGALAGAVVLDHLTGDRITVPARVVVSATGVWVDTVRTLDDGSDPGMVRPAKGVHVTVPWDRVRNDIAVIISVPGDKRSLFLIPWGPLPDGTFEHCYVGTTDTDHGGGLDDPQTDAADLDYVLRALAHSITPPGGRPITRADVTATWAGLRPLVRAASSGRTADLSRRHQVTTSASGLVSVTGGKFTTYRQMAEDTVDVVVARLGRRRRPWHRRTPTRRLPLDGADGFRPSDADGPHHRLSNRYGTRVGEVKDLIRTQPDLALPLVPGLSYLRAEAVYAARHEMATSLADVLCRRTRAHLHDRAACREAAADVAALVAPELGWSTGEAARQVDEYQRLCDREDAAMAAPSGRSGSLASDDPSDDPSDDAAMTNR